MAEPTLEDLLKRIEELENRTLVPLKEIPQGPSSKLDSDTVDGYQVSPASSVSPNTLVPVGTNGKLSPSILHQVVKGTELAANFSTSSGSYVSTGVSVTITPSSSTSRILIFPSFVSRDGSSGFTSWNHFRIYRNGVAIGTEMELGSWPGTGGAGLFSIGQMVLLDSPATTSATTYTLYTRTTNTSDTAGLSVTSGFTQTNPDNKFGNYLIAMEIGPA